MSRDEDQEGPTRRKRRFFRRTETVVDGAEAGCCLIEAVTVFALFAVPTWLLVG
jgi:hypothetical protein